MQQVEAVGIFLHHGHGIGAGHRYPAEVEFGAQLVGRSCGHQDVVAGLAIAEIGKFHRVIVPGEFQASFLYDRGNGGQVLGVHFPGIQSHGLDHAGDPVRTGGQGRGCLRRRTNQPFGAQRQGLGYFLVEIVNQLRHVGMGAADFQPRRLDQRLVFDSGPALRAGCLDHIVTGVFHGLECAGNVLRQFGIDGIELDPDRPGFQNAFGLGFRCRRRRGLAAGERGDAERTSAEQHMTARGNKIHHDIFQPVKSTVCAAITGR